MVPQHAPLEKSENQRFKSMQSGTILTVNVLVLQETLQKTISALQIGYVVLLSKAVQFL